MQLSWKAPTLVYTLEISNACVITNLKNEGFLNICLCELFLLLELGNYPLDS